MNNQKSIVWILFFAFAAFLMSSCNKNGESFSSEDTEISNNESSQDATTSELDDIAVSVLENSQDSGPVPGGRIQLADDRFSCDGTTVTFVDVALDKTSGKAIISFGPNGCLDKKGNTRKGTIIITWTGGKWFNVGASVTVRLENYSINDIQIAGSRTTTCKAYTYTPCAVTWTLTADHTATWPDGTTATRKINKTRKWEHTATEDKFTITNGPWAVNAAEGTNRRGRAYKVYITSPLIYLGSCARESKVFIPVKGEKVINSISSSGKTRSLTVNYGNGTCDNTYTVTSGTLVKTLTANNN